MVDIRDFKTCLLIGLLIIWSGCAISAPSINVSSSSSSSGSKTSSKASNPENRNEKKEGTISTVPLVPDVPRPSSHSSNTAPLPLPSNFPSSPKSSGERPVSEQPALLLDQPSLPSVSPSLIPPEPGSSTRVSPDSPAILDFTPKSGNSGTRIEIIIANLSKLDMSQLSVKVNGIQAVIHERKGETLVVTVPKEASTGKITLLTPSGAIQSKEDFVVGEVATEKPVSTPSPSPSAKSQNLFDRV